MFEERDVALCMNLEQDHDAVSQVVEGMFNFFKKRIMIVRLVTVFDEKHIF